MNASDMPPEMKERISATIKSEFGEDWYGTMVDKFGEDNVIDFYLQNLLAEKEQKEEEEKEKSMKASELSPEMKENLLGEIKADYGDERYRIMINTLGENDVIDVYLKNFQEEKEDKVVKKVVKKPRSFFIDYLGPAVALGLKCDILFFSFFNIFFLIAGPKIGGLLVIIILGVIFLLYLYDNWNELVDNRGEIMTRILALAASCCIIGTIGYCAWKGGPWMWQGVTDWWGWLDSKFT